MNFWRIRSYFDARAIFGLVVDHIGIAAKLHPGIAELNRMVKEFHEATKRGENLGLNEAELAFYDALVDNESTVSEPGNEIPKKIAHELTEKLRHCATVDCQKRESIRARLRDLVRITLHRYKYLPDQQEDAIKLVLAQAGRLSDESTK